MIEGKVTFEEGFSGIDGIQILETSREQFDVIFVDLNMPLMGGIEVNNFL